MKLEVLKYLSDILYNLNAMDLYRQEARSVENIRQNQMLRDAIERRLCNVGEALYQANKLDKDLPITEKRKIMGMRHVLVHDYDKVNPETIYTIVNKHLDLLRQEIETILMANPPQGSLKLDD
jgi:uncharacterized protein with HEPN domain